MAAEKREPPPIFGEDELEKTTSSVSNPLDNSSRNEEKDDDIFAEANEELSLESPVEETRSHITEPSDPLSSKHSQPPQKPSAFSSYAAAAPLSLPKTSLSESAGLSKKALRTPVSDDERNYTIEISVKDQKKVGDGMTAFVAYKVVTKTNIPEFRHTEAEVYRRFSDFLGLYEKLVEKHLRQGRIIPPPPEKSVIGMTKIKMKEESSSAEFVRQRRAALERFLVAVAKHPILQTDPNFVDFLELDGELPRSTSTSALSGTSVMKLFGRVGDSIGKMAYKMEEADMWFEDKLKHVETLDVHLRKLHASFEALVINRKELAQSMGVLANSTAMLGTAEEHTSLSRALSHLAAVEEKVDNLHVNQADNEFYLFTELIKDYVGIIQAIKDVFHERVKIFKTWKDDEATLVKKREVKVRLELAHKMDKIAAASQEITEYEHRVEKSHEEFDNISTCIKEELERFEKQRCHDLRTAIVKYLESLMKTQQELIKSWETFLPEAKAIV